MQTAGSNDGTMLMGDLIHVSPVDVQRLASYFERLEFGPNEVVFEIGESPEFLYVLERGDLSLMEADGIDWRGSIVENSDHNAVGASISSRATVNCNNFDDSSRGHKCKCAGMFLQKAVPRTISTESTNSEQARAETQQDCVTRRQFNAIVPVTCQPMMPLWWWVLAGLTFLETTSFIFC